jgi:hypothetical protein
MLIKMLASRAAEIRTLLDQGALAAARVPLRNGGTLPAEMFAKVALDDLAYLAGLDSGGDSASWGRLAEDIELLHEGALARKYAGVEQHRVRP